MEDKDFKNVLNKAIDHLYEFYECDHSLRMCVWLRPSEDYYEKPEELLTKEQFTETIAGGKWEIALQVLISYISRQDKDASSTCT